ncbi:MAG: class I SAM-dependent DNA methyltransferase [Desulfovibrio sp.]
MSSVFGNYSAYYNLLYRDKDYAGEAAYVLSLLEKHGNGGGSPSVLELGCGTGRHATLMAEQGLHICGVDQSEAMLVEAHKNVEQVEQGSLEFHQGDIRDFRIEKKFDSAISLFHVMSYQTDEKSLANAMKTAATHLKIGGLFVMDCWYGPAVLAEEPEIRIRRLEDDYIHVTRIAEPELHRDVCVVDVNFDLFIRDKSTGIIEELKEKHPMRYFTAEELQSAFETAGLELVFQEEWLSGKPLSTASWSAVFGARRVK